MASAAILAGGQARRYGGADKSALRIGGRTILDRLLTELTAISDDVMVVGRSSSPGQQGATRHVADRVPGQGPLSGLDAALAAARHDLVAIVACDMPFVTGRFIAALLDRAPHAGGRSRAFAVVPRSERGYHPLCAVYSRACGPIVARHLARGRLRMMALLAALDVHAVTGAELAAIGDVDTLLANVNTPGEHVRIERTLNHEP